MELLQNHSFCEVTETALDILLELLSNQSPSASLWKKRLSGNSSFLVAFSKLKRDIAANNDGTYLSILALLCDGQ